MKRCYQDNINQPTKELVEQMLRELTQSPQTNVLVDNYRQMKRRMAEFAEKQQMDAYVKEVV